MLNAKSKGGIGGQGVGILGITRNDAAYQVKKSHSDVKKTMDAVRNFLNPFSPTSLLEKDKLYNLSPGARVPHDIEVHHLRAEEAWSKGTEKLCQR